MMRALYGFRVEHWWTLAKIRWARNQTCETGDDRRLKKEAIATECEYAGNGQESEGCVVRDKRARVGHAVGAVWNGG